MPHQNTPMKKLFFTLLFGFIAMSQLQAQYVYGKNVTGFSRQYDVYPNEWCAQEILGKPNVYPQYDDIGGAWTMTHYGDQRDWISVSFDNDSPADSVLVWETSSAGILDSVFIKNSTTGNWQLVFSRKGQNYPEAADTMARILRIGFPMTSFPVREIKITLANDSSSGWVELDAVALHVQTLKATTVSNAAGTAAEFDGVRDVYQTNFSTWDLMHMSALQPALLDQCGSRHRD